MRPKANMGPTYHILLRSQTNEHGEYEIRTHFGPLRGPIFKFLRRHSGSYPSARTLSFRIPSGYKPVKHHLYAYSPTKDRGPDPHTHNRCQQFSKLRPCPDGIIFQNSRNLCFYDQTVLDVEVHAVATKFHSVPDYFINAICLSASYATSKSLEGDKMLGFFLKHACQGFRIDFIFDGCHTKSGSLDLHTHYRCIALSRRIWRPGQFTLQDISNGRVRSRSPAILLAHPLSRRRRHLASYPSKSFQTKPSKTAIFLVIWPHLHTSTK